MMGLSIKTSGFMLIYGGMKHQVWVVIYEYLPTCTSKTGPKVL
jgi:hypothetical protein